MFLLKDLTPDKLALILGVRAFGKKRVVVFDFGHNVFWLIPVWIDRTLSGGTNRKFEAFYVAIAEFDGPHNEVETTQRLHKPPSGTMSA